MPFPVRTARVREALAPFLGADTPACAAASEQAAEVLRRFVPYQQPLEELTRQLNDALFGVLYACLGPRMTLSFSDGRQVRIRMADIPDLSDCVLGVLIESLPTSQATLDLLRDHAMRETSLSALRALLTRFDRYHSPEEQALMRRVVRDNYPPERYADWLA